MTREGSSSGIMPERGYWHSLPSRGAGASVAPISVIVATAGRANALEVVFKSLLAQTVVPEEIAVVDAAADESVQQLCERYRELFAGRLLFIDAPSCGAAAQRNHGVSMSNQPYVLFMDDDIEFGPDCIEKLWSVLRDDVERVWGGVSAMVVNQQYGSPGRASRWLFRLLSGKPLPTYAGQCIGPAVNLLPQDDPSLPEYVEVSWLPTTCTLYRRDALPIPTFAQHFTGYSLGEDLNLSLLVGRRWRLANSRLARIVHHTHSGPGKPSDVQLAKMALVNRHYIMTRTLDRRSVWDYLKLLLVESFYVVTSLRSPRDWLKLPAVVVGKIQGIASIAWLR